MASEAPVMSPECPAESPAKVQRRPVDGRRRETRRFRAICAELTAELGGSPSAAELHVVRSAASCILASESLQHSQQRGEPVDGDQLVRTANAAARLLATLKAKRSKRPVLTGRAALEAHLRAKYAAADA